MTIFLYDQTFEGLLTAVFDAYSRKSFPDSIFKTGEPLPLFYDEVYTVVTDYEKAERVWKLLVRKLSKGALTTLTYSWLSEAPDIAMLLFLVEQCNLFQLTIVEHVRVACKRVAS